MCSPFRECTRALLTILLACAWPSVTSEAGAAPIAGRELRVCADPGNLPFSDDRGRGFENELATLVAARLGVKLHYVWWAERRGFIRSTLKAGACDVVLGLPVGLDSVRTTRPYYRSTFAFVTRRERHLSDLRSINDARLRELRIGVPLAGDDGANPAPVLALSRRGITDKLVGFSLFREYRREVPAAIEAVAQGSIDVAVLWGPVAGAALHQRVKMSVTPIVEVNDGAAPFAFSIAMGVRRDDVDLADQLDRVIAAEQRHIDTILKKYGVPLLPISEADALEH